MHKRNKRTKKIFNPNVLQLLQYLSFIIKKTTEMKEKRTNKAKERKDQITEVPL